MARMTLWGMWLYRPEIVSGIKLPGTMDVTTFTDLLMEQCGDLYPYIQVPGRLQANIDTWFTAKQNDFQRMYDALMAEYSPIENYDRTEEHSDKLTHSGSDTDINKLGKTQTTKRTGTERVQNGGNDTTITTGTEAVSETGSETTTNSVSAYDATGFQPREQSQRSPGVTTTRTPDLTVINTPETQSTRTPDLQDVVQDGGQDELTTTYGHVEDRSIKIRAHGNIGVTTNQQMIEAEMQMRGNYNMYYVVIAAFEEHFLVQVY